MESISEKRPVFFGATSGRSRRVFSPEQRQHSVFGFGSGERVTNVSHILFPPEELLAHHISAQENILIDPQKEDTSRFSSVF